MPALPANGYTILPAGKLANAVTWLEMRAPFHSCGSAGRPDLSLAAMRGADAGRYMDIYRVLAIRWLWEGRMRMAPAELAQLLADPGVEAFAVQQNNGDCGILELDFRTAGEAELAYFGLFDAVTGQGAGKWLLHAALQRVKRRGVPRLMVHTCNFDHPAALGFYRAQGFAPYRTGFEIMDDPRVNGVLPRDAAPHVPLIV